MDLANKPFGIGTIEYNFNTQEFYRVSYSDKTTRSRKLHTLIIHNKEEMNNLLTFIIYKIDSKEREYKVSIESIVVKPATNPIQDYNFISKINVDIYSDNSYITTLEKNYYGSEAAFNLSPVLSTISENGKSIPYNLKLSKLDRNGSYASIGEPI